MSVTRSVSTVKTFLLLIFFSFHSCVFLFLFWIAIIHKWLIYGCKDLLTIAESFASIWTKSWCYFIAIELLKDQIESKINSQINQPNFWINHCPRILFWIVTCFEKLWMLFFDSLKCRKLIYQCAIWYAFDGKYIKYIVKIGVTVTVATIQTGNEIKFTILGQYDWTFSFCCAYRKQMGITWLFVCVPKKPIDTDELIRIHCFIIQSRYI